MDTQKVGRTVENATNTALQDPALYNGSILLDNTAYLSAVVNNLILAGLTAQVESGDEIYVKASPTALSDEHWDLIYGTPPNQPGRRCVGTWIPPLF